MPRFNSHSTLIAQAIKATGLLLFGIGFQRALVGIEGLIPRGIYFGDSFTLGLHRAWPWTWLLAAASLALLIGSFLDRPRRRVGWHIIDSSGGLRWVAFAMAATLGWAYAFHPHNLYYDQPHFWDRALLVVLLLATLRSPLLLPFFVFEALVSRGQLRHAIHSSTPIADELPIRILGMMTAAALWNWLVTSPRVARRLAERSAAGQRGGGIRIETHSLVYAILCLVGAYYSYAGYAKLDIGAGVFDWVRSVHLENLFVGAWQNGWLAGLPESTVLRAAEWIAAWSPFIAVATIVIEAGMIFLLADRRVTVLLVMCIVGMHLGIVAMTGIFFWKWLVIDIALGVWLWARRSDRSLDRIYSPGLFALSIVLIVAINVTFGTNRFTWWNTRWESRLEIEAVGTDGRVHRVDPRDFHPYMLLDFMETAGGPVSTIVYGMTFSQGLMEKIQSASPEALHASLQRRGPPEEAVRARQERAVDDFMRRTFRTRNRRIATRSAHPANVFTLLPEAPPLHMRFAAGSDLYQDQSRVVEVRIRQRDSFYTGSAIVPIEDRVIHRVTIGNEAERPAR